MKFTEALQKCYENPGIEFEIKSIIAAESLKMRFRKQEDSGMLFLEMNDGEDGEYTHLTGISEFVVESDWQPIPREVTWQEAIEALLYKDVRVKCICKSNSHVSTLEMDYYSKTFDSGSENISGRLITYGKWYILED